MVAVEIRVVAGEWNEEGLEYAPNLEFGASADRVVMGMKRCEESRGL